MPPKKVVNSLEGTPPQNSGEKNFWEIYKDQLTDYTDTNFFENNELLPAEMVEAYECEAPLTVDPPGEAISILYRITNERSSFTPFMPMNLLEAVHDQYAYPQHIFEGDDSSIFSINNDFYKPAQEENQNSTCFTFSHPAQAVISSLQNPKNTADEETQYEVKNLSLEMLSEISMHPNRKIPEFNIESTEPLFFKLADAEPMPDYKMEASQGGSSCNHHFQFSNFISQVVSIEPDQLPLFDEGHLTSTSDLVGLFDVNEDESKEEVSSVKSKTTSIESQEITLSSHSHTKSRDPGIQIEIPQQSSIHNRFLNPSLLKASARAKAAEKNLAARFQAAIGANGQMPRSASLPKKTEHQRKPLQNCCVAAANGGIFRPLFTVFDGLGPKIYWASFPGLHLSPFEPPPVNSEDYLKKQKKKQEAAVAPQPEEAIQMNFCEICKVKFENAQTHRESRLHQERSAQIDWREMDELFSRINKQFKEKF